MCILILNSTREQELERSFFEFTKILVKQDTKISPYISPYFYSNAIQIGGFAGVNLGANESSFEESNDYVGAIGEWENDNSLSERVTSCNPNDNALVAFWHPARHRTEKAFSRPLPWDISRRRLVIEEACITWRSHVGDTRAL